MILIKFSNWSKKLDWPKQSDCHKLSNWPIRIYWLKLLPGHNCVTGHNYLRRHNSIIQFGFEHTDYAVCRHCHQDAESSFHVFAVCDKFALYRRNYFGSDILDLPFDKYKARSIYNFLKEARIDDLLVEYEPP